MNGNACPCGSKPEAETPPATETAAEAEAQRVYKGGRLVKPLRWHRATAGGYFADGELGRYTIRRQRPYRPRGILPRVLTMPDGKTRSFEELDEAKKFAAAYDEIVPQCTQLVPSVPTPDPVVPMPPAPAPEPYVPYGVRREELLERYMASSRKVAQAQDTIPGVGVCKPWVRIVVDTVAKNACMQLVDGQMDGARDLVPMVHEAIGVEDQEVYVVIGLDAHLKVRAMAEIGRGSRDRVPTSIPDTMRYALRFAQDYGAMGVVIAHVHPSGEVKPSEADEEVTKAVKDACDTNGLIFIDHLIIGGPVHAQETVTYRDLQGREVRAGFYSFREHGELKD